MNVIQQFNGLNGRVVSRSEIEKILQTAKQENAVDVVYRISKILNENPHTKRFEVNITEFEIEPISPTFLAGIPFEEINEENVGLNGLAAAVSPDQIYTMVTQKMLEMMKKASGKGYKKAWGNKNNEGLYSVPYNFVSKKPYQGINFFMLKNGDIFSYLENPYFLTFKQIENLGGKLKKGSEGYEVIYYTNLYLVKKEGKTIFGAYNYEKIKNYLKENNLSEDDIRKYPILKYYNVFNGKDIEGIDFKLEKSAVPVVIQPEENENPYGESIVKYYPTCPRITHGGDKAFYHPARDFIQLPKKENFDTSNDYFRTLFHEMAHSTGHKKRLNRDLSGSFGSKKYAFEELIAEFTSVFVSAHAGIVWYGNKNHAEYLKNWSKVIGEMEEDNKFVVKAAAQAQKAANYILDCNENGEPAFYKDFFKEEKSKNLYSTEKQKDKGNKNEKDKKQVKKADKETEKIFVKLLLPLYLERKNNPRKFTGHNDDSPENFRVEDTDFWEKFTDINTDLFKTKASKKLVKITEKGKELLEKEVKKSQGNNQPKKNAENITQFPLKDIYTDEKRFQNRKKLNETIVKNIVENFRETDLDPLVIWKDPKDKKHYILAGHHRFEALKQLKKKEVPVKIANKDYPTEADAIRYAKEISNANRTLEEPYERAEIYRKYRENGLSQKEILEKAEIEGKNRNYVLNLSFLNPKGTVLQALMQFSQSQSKNDRNEMERVADWIGQARRQNEQLTHQHETEMLHFLKDKEASKRFSTKAQFLELVKKSFNMFAPESALNLKRFKYQSEGEKVYNQEVSEIKSEIEKQQSYIDDLKQRFSNPLHKDFISPDDKDYVMLKKIADDKISEYNTKIAHLQRKLLSLYQNKQNYTKSSGQTALFGATSKLSLTTDDLKKMSVPELRAFTLQYYLTHLKGKKVALKNFIKEVVFTTKAGRKIAHGEAMYKEKAVVIEHLEELIKNSTYNNWGDRKPQDNENILGYLNFKSKLIIDGEKRHIRIAIILDKNRNFELKSFDVGKKKNSRASKGTLPSAEEAQLFDRKITKNSENTKQKPKKERKKQHKQQFDDKFDEFCRDFFEIDDKQIEINKKNAKKYGLSAPSSPPAPPLERVGVRNLAKKMASRPTEWEFFRIDNPQMANFLGKVEKKAKDSVVITLTGGQGSGKTRFAFQFINDLAQNYKVGHISNEEQPDSSLYYDKVQQYLNQNALQNVEPYDVRTLEELNEVIQRNEIIVIDSFQKIKELDPKFEVDKDLRKKYNGKLFLVIFQQTSDGKMRGGSKSQFDGDIILFTEKFDDYRENYVYPDKNRYNSVPANELKYSIFQQRLLPSENQVQPVENQTEELTFDVIM